MRQIFLDTETTGLSAATGDRIIEIACVELIARKPTGNNWHFYLNPERDSHEGALKVHGISNEFLRDKPKFAALADDLLAYLQGADLIIHNAPFDVSFLDKELALVGKPALGTHIKTITDSLLLAKEIFPGKRNSLDALCERLGVDNSNRTLHGALLDAQLLADVYLCLTRGQNTLIMEHSSTRDQKQSDISVNFSELTLPLLQANEQELAAHEAVLLDLDKASKGQTVWQRVPHTSGHI